MARECTADARAIKALEKTAKIGHSTLMQHTILETADGISITLEGEFDLYSCADLRKELVERVQKVPVDVRFDCRGVDFIDSSGMGLIMQLHFMLKKSGHKLVLAGLSERILSLFRAIKLDKALGAAIEPAPPETGTDHPPPVTSGQDT